MTSQEKKTHVVFLYSKEDGSYYSFNIIKNKTDKEIEEALERVKDEMIYRYKWIKDEDVIKAFVSKPKTSPIEDIKDEIVDEIKKLKSAVYSLENRVGDLGDELQ